MGRGARPAGGSHPGWGSPVGAGGPRVPAAGDRRGRDGTGRPAARTGAGGWGRGGRCQPGQGAPRGRAAALGAAQVGAGPGRESPARSHLPAALPARHGSALLPGLPPPLGSARPRGRLRTPRAGEKGRVIFSRRSARRGRRKIQILLGPQPNPQDVLLPRETRRRVTTLVMVIVSGPAPLSLAERRHLRRGPRSHPAGRLAAALRPPELYLCAAAGVVSAGGFSALGVFFPHHLVLLRTSLLLLYSCRAETRSSLKCSPPQKHTFSSRFGRQKASPGQGRASPF